MNKRTKMPIDELQRICIGTVYQGTDYGYAGASRPPEQDSITLFAQASDMGVGIFDTAAEYGEAERLLGEVFGRGKERHGRARIVSKLPHGLAVNASKADYLFLLEGLLNKTLAHLNLRRIDGYLFHSHKFIYNRPAVEAMHELKMSGLMANIGVSVYDPDDAAAAANTKEIDYIQVPYNVFDARLDRTGFFDMAKSNGKTVFARSIFLQGMLLETPGSVPDWLAGARPHIAKFREIIGKTDPAEVCVHYCRSNKRIDYIIMGIRDEGDLAEDVSYFSSTVDAGVIERLGESFNSVENGVIDPRLWRKG
jgi:aryl-alcohol dehydrogenase-like predicted oxidoreductase